MAFPPHVGNHGADDHQHAAGEESHGQVHGRPQGHGGHVRHAGAPGHNSVHRPHAHNGEVDHQHRKGQRYQLFHFLQIPTSYSFLFPSMHSSFKGAGTCRQTSRTGAAGSNPASNWRGYQPYRAFRPVRDIQRSSTTRAHCSATWRNAAETGFCPGSSRATGGLVPAEAGGNIQRNLAEQGHSQFSRFPFAASFAKDMVNLAVRGALEITHVFNYAQNGVSTRSKRPIALRASISATSCGVVTTTTPSSSAVWTMVS